MYIVYKAYGPNDNQVYYGYAQGTEEDVARTFYAGNNRTDPDRTEKRMVELNGGDPDDIKFEVVDVFTDELDAWVTRNDLRAMDAMSITGPTMFPGYVRERAEKERPEAFKKWKLEKDLSKAKTARIAWGMGKWDKDTIRGLTGKFKQADVVRDLDALSPADFSAKYKV